MTASYIFSPKGLSALAHFVTPDTLFAFDLDGTLAPIVEDYAAVEISEPVRATLGRLVKIAKVAVITGRSRQDALAILGFEPHVLVGSHGAEWPVREGRLNSQQSQQSADCLIWREKLFNLLSNIPGVEIEFKGESLSLHYRKADDAEATLLLIDAAIDTLIPEPRRIGGKYVVNLVPMKALTKGDALIAAMEMFEAQRAIFIGDDVTDEEVFKLNNANIFGIHIGKDDQTAARYYLKKQSALLGLLNSMVGILESYKPLEMGALP
ncbi:MAG: trehalose-phosphatase [Desulfuromonadaceae bacterium]|nr:trehalose-phosphatase [Desulfuromonadaceae bacterium]